MTSRLVLKELKAGFKATNKFPVTEKTSPVSKATAPKLMGDVMTLGSISATNNFCKPNKRLEKPPRGERALVEVRSMLRGTNSVAQVYQNTFRIFSGQSKVYHCDFFRLLYFPPEHFLSVFRKSKPAVNVRIVGEVFLNGNVSKSQGRSVANTAVYARGSRIEGYGKSQDVSNLKQLQNVFANDGSNVPRNYAYLRRSLRASLNKWFIQHWMALQGPQAVEEQIRRQGEAGSSAQWQYLDAQGRSKTSVAKDGFYLFQVLVFPDKTTKQEFKANVARGVKTVADLEWDDFLRSKSNKSRTWVQECNDRVRVPVMNSYLANDQMPRVLRKLQSSRAK
ncbi:Pet130p [Lachancea thermotolerans CBS 6340]|uniref:KLTH0B02398p n=1 Tax=Lachancea thermotolerans (strain ATCC 56472 / CBS 6340 / NRRL Y-8284) TaxID=559295 RepID=C5DCE5_LACTC|nr:KLTH0B02398p [Lachancea thermotolerans CBS 6340]CAR21456.1 KLTH0B02398p [Lachancea thermotolerans CBS 6340]